MDPQYINDNYRKLYRFLKSQSVVKSIRENEYIINIIKSLPPPDVATYIDIFYVCKECMMGSLECFYNEFEEETKDFIRDIVKNNESPNLEYYSLTLSKINKDIQSISQGIQFLYEKLNFLQDITLKGQCPYCHGPLVANIKNQNTLIFRCYSQSKPECQNNVWEIGQIVQTKP